MITKQIVHLRDFAQDAAKLRGSYGQTNKFSSSAPQLDIYLGGGYGRDDAYEIVVIYGPTGVGKSTVALNFLRDPVRQGKKVGMLVLEDDGPDVFLRFADILGHDDTNKFVMKSENIHFLPPDALTKSWSLEDLLVMIDEWFEVRGMDVIMLDHLQFAFEGAESIKGENEYIAQRIFMQKLNQMMKKNKRTIILVSHTNKDGSSKGMNRIVGSGAIAQAGTKVIEIEDEDGGKIKLNMRKSRFTRKPGYHFAMRLVKNRLVALT